MQLINREVFVALAQKYFLSADGVFRNLGADLCSSNPQEYEFTSGNNVNAPGKIGSEIFLPAILSKQN